MSLGITEYAGPEDGSAMIAAKLNDAWVIAANIPDFRVAIQVFAVCDRCSQVAGTGMMISAADLPLQPVGQWPHTCGGLGMLPDQYVVTDRRTGEQFDLYRPARQRIVASTVTLAELLRLAQAARAVQDGRAGAEERLDRVLAEAPEPIRELRDRWTRQDKMMLASVIISLAAFLIPLLKGGGGVTTEQLVTVIERLVDERSGDGDLNQPAGSRQQGGGTGQAGEEPRPVSGCSPDRDGAVEAPREQPGVEQPRG